MSSNRFDDRAATWDDDPVKVERANAAASAVRGAVPLSRDLRVLEYGAGTGLVSQALQDDVGPIMLADSSSGMLDVLRNKVAAGAIADARVVDLDLSRDPVPQERFDVIVTVMTLHHISDLGPVMRAFATMLRAGGHLCVIDLEEEDGSFHGPDFDGHDGLNREDLAARLEQAGFADIRFEHCYRLTKHDRPYDLFLATCSRQR